MPLNFIKRNLVIKTRLYRAAFFIVLIVCTSCNPTSLYLKGIQKTYKENGLTERTVTIGEQELFFRQTGEPDGNPVVLIHGFGPFATLQWENQVAGLSDSLCILVPDLLYFGKSKGNGISYSAEAQADALAQAMNLLGHKSYAVTGLSYGGMVAALLAHRYPENVTGLALIDPLNKYYSNDYADSLVHALGAQDKADLLLPEDGKQLKRLLQLTYYDPPGFPAFLLNQTAKQTYRENKADKIKLLNYLEEHRTSYRTRDYSFAGPVLLIWGRHDQLIPLRMGRQLEKDYAKGTQLFIIEEAGHVPQLEQPDQVNLLLRDFFSRIF